MITLKAISQNNCLKIGPLYNLKSMKRKTYLLYQKSVLIVKRNSHTLRIGVIGAKKQINLGAESVLNKQSVNKKDSISLNKIQY